MQTTINKKTTYQLVTKRAGHGTAAGIMTYHETGKDFRHKEISKKLCSTNNKEGRWTCSKITYPDGRRRSYCGCLYDIDKNDPNNILDKNI